MRSMIFVSAVPALLATVMATSPAAQSLSGYREFSLGATVASVAASTRVPASAFRTVHETPALLQEFEWRPSHYAAIDTTPDTIDEVTFSFYNDQLSRMVVTYYSRQTAGMTSADIVSALTSVYGTPGRTRGTVEPDFGPLAAIWQSDSSTVELFRGSDAWRLVLTSRALQASARAAAERARQEQTRRANTAAFRP